MSDQPSLRDQLATEPVRPRVVAECVTLIDQQVKAKGGLSGVAIKGAYGTVKKIKPRMVPDTVDGLLDDWLERLEPYYGTWRTGGSGTFTEFLTARSDEVAEELLTVTDERSQNTKHKTAKKMYDRMRPSAKKNVVEGIPELARLVERHLQDGAADTGAA